MDQPEEAKLFGLKRNTAIIIGIIAIALIIVLYLYFVGGDEQTDQTDEKDKKTTGGSGDGEGSMKKIDNDENCITNTIKRILNRQSRNLKSMC
jgi:hypothetical protein